MGGAQFAGWFADGEGDRGRGALRRPPAADGCVSIDNRSEDGRAYAREAPGYIGGNDCRARDSAFGDGNLRAYLEPGYGANQGTRDSHGVGIGGRQSDSGRATARVDLGVMRGCCGNRGRSRIRAIPEKLSLGSAAWRPSYAGRGRVRTVVGNGAREPDPGVANRAVESGGYAAERVKLFRLFRGGFLFGDGLLFWCGFGGRRNNACFLG